MNKADVFEKLTTDSVKQLLAEQFPQWADLAITPIAKTIYENQIFRLGDQMSVRLPTSAEYAPQVIKEYEWLPKIAAKISFQIPEILALGQPSSLFPWHWSIRPWIAAESARDVDLASSQKYAASLAQFLNELHAIDGSGGPTPGFHSFHRGGPISFFDEKAQQGLLKADGIIDIHLARAIWEKALASQYHEKPVWIHGDMNSANLLISSEKLIAVIDFGSIAVGDPACDLVMAWTFFDKEGRRIFKAALNRDAGQWERARGWALFKVLYTIGFSKETFWPSAQSLFARILED